MLVFRGVTLPFKQITLLLVKRSPPTSPIRGWTSNSPGDWANTIFSQSTVGYPLWVNLEISKISQHSFMGIQGCICCFPKNPKNFGGPVIIRGLLLILQQQFKRKMAIFEKVNYYWRYTHFSLNHDYGRKDKAGAIILQTPTMHYYRGIPQNYDTLLLVWSTQNGVPFNDPCKGMFFEVSLNDWIQKPDPLWKFLSAEILLKNMSRRWKKKRSPPPKEKTHKKHISHLSWFSGNFV